ncbi:hypothetical protein [Verrucomicrobium spinosum]|uniref:hypothetical protein n=1 Tax=Verrucomicrobium spinosum TaxID=2736 RepID=UPI00094653B5|nr:hypothetical protein [Verrucomicrobium spinosum]
MNPVRLILLLAAIGSSLAWLYVGGGRGQFPEVDPWYLDFLVANTRNKDSEASQSLSSDVVLVQFREDEKAEYSAWPPAPLDYIMAMKRIAHHERSGGLCRQPPLGQRNTRVRPALASDIGGAAFGGLWV